jgi:hypothetical protein
MGDAGEVSFPLTDDDLDCVRQLERLVRKHLPSLKPRDLRGAPALLLALERLPRNTPGLTVQATFHQPNTDGNWGWADIYFTDEEFALGIGEHFYDPRVGGDTESQTMFRVSAEEDSSNEADEQEWERRYDRSRRMEEWMEYASARADDGKLTVDDEGTDHEQLEWGNEGC